MKNIFRGNRWSDLVLRVASIYIFLFFIMILSVLFSKVIADSIGMDGDTCLRFSQIFSTVACFGVPAFLFGTLYSDNLKSFLGLSAPKPTFFIYAVLAILFAEPIINYMEEGIRQIELPSSLSFFVKIEEESDALINGFVWTKSFTTFLSNALMLAVAPAVCEELFFRGLFFATLKEKIKSVHICVWITAIIFALIHISIFKFIPILLLGAFLGYLRVWSGSLLVPITAHFVNNFFIVLIGYLVEKESVEATSIDFFPVVIVSIVLFLAMVFCLKKSYLLEK